MSEMSEGKMPAVSAPMLRANRLFTGLSDAALEGLVRALPSELATPGQVLMSEGELATHMFAIVNGELEVVSRGGGQAADVRVALLGPGDWFGEMAILDVQPRSATVRALAPSVLLRLTADDVKRHLQDKSAADYARMMVNIARELSRRLRVADRLIAQASAAVVKQYVESLRPPAP